jgi:serine protease Do
MSRLSSPLVPLATLGIGIVLGIVADRGGAFVVAQSPPRTRGEGMVKAASTTKAATASVNKVEDDLYKTLARQYEQFEHVNRTFELVAKAVSPAVVHIVAQKMVRSEDPGHSRRYEETGSGVIVRDERGQDLYVMTNHHVIEGAKPEKVNIFLQDGRVLHPNRMLLDKMADIAVLGLPRRDLPAVRFGDSDEAVVGTWVLALGSPFGLTHSVSQGIVSARGRHMEELADVENQDFLQTDAAINPGNSGGPLVNMKGEVIGINNSIASNGGGNEGVGFSIPINLARWIMNQLLAHGRVARGALGIVLHREFRAEDAAEQGLDRPRGAWISMVHPRSPAAAAGLRDGDIVLSFRGVEVSDVSHLINLVSMAPIGGSAELVVWRDHKMVSFNVTVGDRDTTNPPTAESEPMLAKGFLRRPDRPQQPLSQALGLEFSTVDSNLASRVGLPDGEEGALITKIRPGSPLGAIVRLNDVISKVDGRPIRTADEAARALNRSTDHTPLRVEFDRVVKGTIEHRSIEVP